MSPKILIIGACGQIGSELTLKLREKYGRSQVIASDIREGEGELMSSGPFEILDATNSSELEDVILHYDINQVYLMAAMLSATAEKFPMKGWQINMDTLFNVLNLAKDQKIQKIFWPSSIAVFGLSTPKHQTPQQTIMEPTTVYGISKQTGERWCAYYHNRYGVDVRSLRYPGLISHKTQPGGGTTDYAIEIFRDALKHKKYTCFLKADTALPMMYMDDAIEATIQIMSAPEKNIKLRSSYNLSALSVTPKKIAELIKAYIPEFEIKYQPDFRQSIAESWPTSIDDSSSRKDWGWQHQYNLEQIAEEMIEGLKPKVSIKFDG
ncbi:NAD-dependent epimerase/dehydratase family protein [Mesohalobacter halotolerans]|uniref:NAD-dependent epimerase/dehydratase family protein n=1 Tax=Mesohalobacter halotolerans TaxID=1883405 RepID=A0A4U5TPK9_9FLAO|nr:NAD-dependent epimerase/dehydratase family protein [Mesohalobacter halotolerans]MBS3737968.1 NAD-dependent epimerase/dehydratase family protein [Psychroflexus sp.]TKS56049.1 NAD-dependent epimerase/dehydratase family protein [Mesohalobacter halotolerans]